MSTTIVLIQIESWPFLTGIKVQDLLTKNIILDYKLEEIISSPLISEEIKMLANPFTPISEKDKKEQIIKQLYGNPLTSDFLNLDINTVRFRIDNGLTRIIQEIEKKHFISFNLQTIERQLHEKTLEELIVLAQDWWNTIEVPDINQQVLFPEISLAEWEQEQKLNADDLNFWSILRNYIYWKKYFSHQKEPFFEAIEKIKQTYLNFAMPA